MYKHLCIHLLTYGSVVLGLDGEGTYEDTQDLGGIGGNCRLSQAPLLRSIPSAPSLLSTSPRFTSAQDHGDFLGEPNITAFHARTSHSASVCSPLVGDLLQQNSS